MQYKAVAHTRDATLDELIDEMHELEEKLENLGEVHHVLYRAIIEQMDEIGATVARSETHVAKLTPKVTYDQSVLAKLREITDPEDLAGVYTPEHEEVRKVPEKWNMVRGKKLLRLGNDHRQIIASAKKFSANPSLKIYRNDTTP
jgi:phage terminase large subunit-like protein